MKTARTVPSIVMAAAIQLIGTIQAKAQILPPPVLLTNYLYATEVVYCDGVSNTSYAYQVIVNISTNANWQAPNNRWQFDLNTTGCMNETNVLVLTWTESGNTNETFSTNIVTDTSSSWTWGPPYEINSTNSLTHRYHFHVPGPNTTLAFSDYLGGPVTWSGSTDYDLYPGASGVHNPLFIQAQNTVTLEFVSFFGTNYTYYNGVLTNTEPLHQ